MLIDVPVRLCPTPVESDIDKEEALTVERCPTDKEGNHNCHWKRKRRDLSEQFPNTWSSSLDTQFLIN